MRLNLHIIKEDLADYQLAGQIHASCFSYPLCYSIGCAAWPDNPSQEVVYAIDAAALPQKPPKRCHLSIICIGEPPAEWKECANSVLWTQKEATVLELASDLSAIFWRYEELDEVLLSAIDGKETISNAARAASSFFHNPFAAFSTSFRKIFAFYPDFENPSDAYRAYRDQTENDYPFMSDADVASIVVDPTFSKLPQAEEPVVYSFSAFDYETLLYTVRIGGIPCLYLGSDAIVSPFTDRDLALVKIFGDRLSAMIPVSDAYQMTHPEVVREVLAGLLNHKLLPEQRIQQLLDYYSWNMNDSYSVLVSRASGDQSNSSYLESVAMTFARSTANDCYAIQDGLMVFVFNLSERHASVSELRDRLLPLARSLQMDASVSSSFNDFKNLYYFYQQAKVVQEERWEDGADEKLRLFDEEAVDYICHRLTKRCGPSIAEVLIPEGLTRLVEHDALKGSDYAHLLEVYLDNERNIAKTIRQEFIHRNTFNYRLERIEAISKLDLDDPDVRLQLQLAFRLMRLSD